MISRVRDLFGTSHDQLVDAVEQVLREQHWDVSRDQILGTVRPDIVARKPGGPTYVFEVKRGQLDANLGAVAQVETFRRAAAQLVDGDAQGVLLVTGRAPENRPALDAAASGADVKLVWAPSAGVGTIRESLASSGVLEQADANGGPSIGQVSTV